MNDYTGVELCIKQYEKSEETIAKAGLKPQEPADVVMRTMNAVGIRITQGAKAFLYKEYIYLTIWSCSFAIVLGSTVDLLEMSMKIAPTNFPYTAISFLTGSITSIAAGYIGMRIAVYTNTRVTFQCCTSVHKGFVTAFRGGQVLGFVLVGMGILNIMILILLFKACWYNHYLKAVCASGKPYNMCPAGTNKGFVAANTELWNMLVAKKDEAYAAYYKGYTTYHDTWCKDAPAAPQKITADAFYKTHKDCHATELDFLASKTDCDFTKAGKGVCSGALTNTEMYTSKTNKDGLYLSK